MIAVLEYLKSCGLNANWDMIYLIATYQLIRLLEQLKDAKRRIEKWVANEIDRRRAQEIAAVLKAKI